MEEDKVAFCVSKVDKGKAMEIGEGSNRNVVSREAPLVEKDLIASAPLAVSELEKDEESGPEKKLSRHDRIELGRLFQGAVSSLDWELADSLILLADPQTLNDALCIALDSIWFLSKQEELYGITDLMIKIIANGAYDFTRAALRTSFLASCVSACRSRTMSLADAVTVMAQRLHERLQECNGDEVLKVEAGAKVQKFTEWALKCIGFHSTCQGKRDSVGHNTGVEIQLQLSAFKTFLGLAGDHLTGKDFTEAFDAACFPLTLFSSSFDPGWASGISATTIQGLLGMLVEGGADNVNQCFLEASQFGSTELVRILLQIAQRNSLDIDVDLALGFASRYGKLDTMDCLVEEGNAMAFLGPLMRAAERGCLQVVEWFVKRELRDMEICLALTAATSSNQVEVAAYLLPHVPQHVLAALSFEILKAAAERSGGSHDGVAFLLSSDFLGDPTATYAVADSIAKSDDDTIAPELRAFLQEHWSIAAFLDGMREGQEHFSNLVRILKWGESPICLKDLPGPLRVAIAYLPLYRECVKAGGCLLSQRLRGQLVEAAERLGYIVDDEANERKQLLAILEHHLPPFLMAFGGNDHTRSTSSTHVPTSNKKSKASSNVDVHTSSTHIPTSKKKSKVSSNVGVPTSSSHVPTSKKKSKVSGNIGVPTSSTHEPSQFVPPRPTSFPPPLYSLPHLGYTAPTSTPYYSIASSLNMHVLRSSRSVNPIMHAPRPEMTSSSYPVLPSTSCPVNPAPFTSSTPFASFPFMSSSSIPSYGIRQTIRHSSMPSSESTRSSAHSISRPHVRFDDASASSSTDTDRPTHPPIQISVERQFPPDVGKLDDHRRLIIAPDGARMPTTKSWRSSCLVSRKTIKEIQSNRPRNRSKTYGLRLLVACIRVKCMVLALSVLAVPIPQDFRAPLICRSPQSIMKSWSKCVGQ